MEEDSVTREGLEHLENIESELEEIKEYTGSPRGWFYRGLMQGAGVVVGSIVALALLGWVLSLVGIIPGLSELADYLREVAGRI
ncbi:MAG TPA: hypothetical protein VJB97_02730 [Candidatus Paceibacterota bacterium]